MATFSPFSRCIPGRAPFFSLSLPPSYFATLLVVRENFAPCCSSARCPARRRCHRSMESWPSASILPPFFVYPTTMLLERVFTPTPPSLLYYIGCSIFAPSRLYSAFLFREGFRTQSVFFSLTCHNRAGTCRTGKATIELMARDSTSDPFVIPELPRRTFLVVPSEPPDPLLVPCPVDSSPPAYLCLIPTDSEQSSTPSRVRLTFFPPSSCRSLEVLARRVPFLILGRRTLGSSNAPHSP